MRMNNKYPWPMNVIRIVVDVEGDLPFVVTPKHEQQLMDALAYLSEQSNKHKRMVDMLTAYYKDGKSMVAIGRDYGVSNSMVSLEVRDCIRRLRYPSVRQKFMPLLITIDEIDEYYRKKMAELDERRAKLDARERRLNLKEGILNIEDMDLSVRAYNCLARAGIKTSKEIEEAIKSGTLVTVRNLGRKSYDQIMERMNELFGDRREETFNVEDMGLSQREFFLLKRAGLNTSKDIIERIENDEDRSKLKKLIRPEQYNNIITRLNELLGTNYSLYEEE